MKLLKISSILLFSVLVSTNLCAQSNTKSISLKKGEILDILLIKTKPGTEKAFEKYRKTAFPVAFKRTYQPLPGFKIAETTQGNIQPSYFALGKWNDLENREKFIAEIETEVPDFHPQRRDIWSHFHLTYYEMPNDISVTFNKDKYIVATAYWKKDDTSFDKFVKLWLQKSKAKGGDTVLQLTNGKSPAGYYHNPDILLMTAWNSKAEFESFYKENLAMNHSGILHLNQFVLN